MFYINRKQHERANDCIVVGTLLLKTKSGTSSFIVMAVVDNACCIPTNNKIKFNWEKNLLPIHNPVWSDGRVIPLGNAHWNVSKSLDFSFRLMQSTTIPIKEKTILFNLDYHGMMKATRASTNTHFRCYAKQCGHIYHGVFHNLLRFSCQEWLICIFIYVNAMTTTHD